MSYVNDKPQYKVCGVFDTETCNFGSGSDVKAYVVCYQVNDLRTVRLDKYVPDKSDHISIFRSETQMLQFIAELIAWGERMNKIPVVAAYNLMFDLKSLLYDLRAVYSNMQVNAQSTTSAYTLDIMDSSAKHIKLRFWDTFYLDMRGLHAMGEVAGLPKADGDWDYTLLRTPDTPLTEKEVFYASRDVQVIPAYLRYLLDANEWLTSDMFGVNVLTKTSLVRQMAKKTFSKLKIPGSKYTVQREFHALCQAELPADYEQYATRKACFRGGLTFTSAAFASVIMRNVASLDVTSMHHTFMSSKIPTNFKRCHKEILDLYAQRIIQASRKDVLANYCRPFYCGLHAKVRFKNLRIKPDTCYDTWGIATLARSKFYFTTDEYDRWERNDAVVAQNENNYRIGYHDKAFRPVFAFGKLYSAQIADVWVSEIELWIMSRVYMWDSFECIQGECTTSFTLPPDYVSLQSNMLFEMKSAMKTIVHTYRENIPYTAEISDLIPKGIIKMLRDGSASEQFIESYYTSTVKGMFNGIYGTQAQDVYKPSFMINADGSLSVNSDDVCNADNFADKQPEHANVFYDYGLRIVGRSRMHLCIAMELLYEAFDDKCRVTGGDTDSLKCATTVSDSDILSALKPLHDAADDTINKGYARIRKNYPTLCSTLKNVGHFDIEKCGNTYRYPYHMELWNKCRLSIDTNNKPHVTCAGLSRPEGIYNINDYLTTLIKEHGPKYALTHSLGYNTMVTNSVCHALERTNPKNDAVFNQDVRDYLGNISHVYQHEVYAIYDTGRLLGEMVKATSMENVLYLKKHYNRDIDTTYKVVSKL